MRGQSVLALGLILSILGAGCTSTGTSQAPAPTVAPSASVTADTGSVSGTVTDDEQKPLSGVTVALLQMSQAATTTDAGGRFTINDVSPGSYVIVAQRLGYEEFSKKITVVAGEVTSVVGIMKPITIDEARHEAYQLDAYMQAGVSTPLITFRPGILLNDKLIFSKDIAGGVMSVVTAMTWDSSAPATAKKMRLDLIVGTALRNQTNQKSPMMNIVEDCDDEARTECSAVFAKKTSVQHSIWIPFTCPYTQPTHPDCSSDPPSGLIVLVVEQRYKLYVTTFWGDVAPREYTGLPA